MSEGYPYGSVPLSPVEQQTRYLEMQGNAPAWQAMIMRLEDKYRGLPDAHDKVQQDIDRFVARMQRDQQRIGRLGVGTAGLSANSGGGTNFA